MNKDSRLTIRIKEKDKEALIKDAHKQGRTLSNYVSLLLMKGRESLMKKGLIVLITLLFVGCGHQDAASNASTWTADQRDTVLQGCLATATSKYTSSQVSTYCNCVTDAVVSRFTSSDYNMNPQADSSQLLNDGTTAGCKTKAGI